uniref:Uncharacterized protein n=1 Tax=Photinus pyralis TaxID=7054 RepID=A0A1Y1LND8_PHOPY
MRVQLFAYIIVGDVPKETICQNGNYIFKSPLAIFTHMSLSIRQYKREIFDMPFPNFGKLDTFQQRLASLSRNSGAQSIFPILSDIYFSITSREIYYNTSRLFWRVNETN